MRYETNENDARRAHRLMIGVHKDDFVVFVNAILIYPIRVQNPQISATPAYALFRRAPETALELEVVDTMANRFTIGCSYDIN